MSSSLVTGQNIHLVPKGDIDSYVKASQKSMCWKLKTNLLYDVLAVPNISTEMHIANNWSLGLGYWYTWWQVNPCHRYWRSYGGEIDIRKYIGNQATLQPLTGHHIGVVCQMGMYDVEFGKRGNMSDFAYTFGAEYGYTFPIGPRLSLDLSMALGYFGGKYKEYDPIDTHYVWQESHDRKWIGPIKAEITLAYQLGKFYKNEKGGRQ